MTRLLSLLAITVALLALLLAPVVLAKTSPLPDPRPEERPRPLLVPDNPTLDPLSNTHTAPPTTTVSITYDEPINPATVSTRTFAVHAMQTGLLTGTYSASGGAIRLTPPRPFKPGELAQVSATTGTLNLSGQGPLSPRVWQFRTAVSGGSGVFTDSGQSFPLSDTTAIALGDLDGDGDLDAFVSNGYSSASQDNQIWLNDGRGNFSDSGQILGDQSAWRAALGDLDQDGDLDIFAGPLFVEDFAEIWFNDGVGLFSKSSQDFIGSGSGATALGDVDGDGDLDAFIGYYMPSDDPVNQNQVWLNDGRGVFTDSLQRLGDLDTYAVGLGDLDGDGDLDALTANGDFDDDQPNQVWLNDGRGVFTNPYPGLGDRRSTDVALGDLDGDGDLDAFVTNYQGQANEVWLNDGLGVFSDTLQQLGDSDSWAVKLGDLDGDSDLDAFVVNAEYPPDAQGQANQVWLNDGRARFTPSSQQLGGDASFAVDLGDLDGDGDLDAFAGNADVYTMNVNLNRVWFNTGRPEFSDVVLHKSVKPAQLQPGQPLTYRLTLTNIGRAVVSDVIVSDEIPAGITVQAVSSSLPVTPSHSGNNYTWPVGRLDILQTGVITIAGRVDPALTGPATIVNTAAVAAANDNNLSNNEARAGVSVSVSEAFIYLPVVLNTLSIK